MPLRCWYVNWPDSWLPDAPPSKSGRMQLRSIRQLICGGISFIHLPRYCRAPRPPQPWGIALPQSLPRRAVPELPGRPSPMGKAAVPLGMAAGCCQGCGPAWLYVCRFPNAAGHRLPPCSHAMRASWTQNAKPRRIVRRRSQDHGQLSASSPGCRLAASSWDTCWAGTRCRCSLRLHWDGLPERPEPGSGLPGESGPAGWWLRQGNRRGRLSNERDSGVHAARRGHLADGCPWPAAATADPPAGADEQWSDK